jgi:hypothetical protein
MLYLEYDLLNSKCSGDLGGHDTSIKKTGKWKRKQVKK